MRIYASVLYALRPRRSCFGLGPSRMTTELIGLCLLTRNNSLVMFDLSCREKDRNKTNFSPAFDQIPSAHSPLWHLHKNLLTDLLVFFMDLPHDSVIVTNGDPHEAALLASLMEEAGVFNRPTFESVRQRLADAASWLPDNTYGAESGFGRYIPKENKSAPYSLEHRMHMFTSHALFEEAQGTKLIDIAASLRRTDKSIQAIMDAELDRMINPTVADTLEGE